MQYGWVFKDAERENSEFSSDCGQSAFIWAIWAHASLAPEAPFDEAYFTYIRRRYRFYDDVGNLYMLKRKWWYGFASPTPHRVWISNIRRLSRFVLMEACRSGI